MFVQDRNSNRRFFVEVWEKYQSGQPLQPLEDLVLAVIKDHPEYHALLEQDENILLQEYAPDMGVTNPFLHMGMHIAIREQVSSDRPPGIRKLYQDLRVKSASVHGLEHNIMECLGETLWSAQRNNTLPDEAVYLDCIKRIP
ncbi:MAG: hypothetical protein A2W69_01260 [Gammaproteobacteria bacterium RIFCSPLOWO2_02_47_7]|nr:MAG: hypothetical protein A2W69_01260 [Gammaproteobacteria bacterium RIFCSPLOWO2_02_47_7]